jgi:hypothetical protein
MNHAAGAGMRPGKSKLRLDFRMRRRDTNLSLRRVGAMRRAILVVRLLRIALTLRRVALVVTLALLSMLRAVIAIILLLAMAAAVIVVTRHLQV